MAHCHGPDLTETIKGDKRIVLAGNPNTGKSVFFNYLTGLYVDVSNYPGTTLEISHGRIGNDVVVDTPGVYGISSFNDEERVARDIILSADLVVNIVDATNLERDLFLTQQVIDTGIPVLLVLNMMDEADRHGININVALLSELLGVPVIPAVAVKKIGLSEVKDNLPLARPGNVTPGVQHLLDAMIGRVANKGEALLLLEGDQIISGRHGLEPGEYREEIYSRRRERVNIIVGHAVEMASERKSFSQTLSGLMIRPITGIPMLALILYGMYKAIGVFVAQTVVGVTEETIMIGMFEPAVRGLIGEFTALDSPLGQILAGEFGVFTMTFTYVLGLLMPLVAGFYFFLALFEDSGYLPRLATLVDRLLTGMGLNGRGVIPLILGFGCVTMATITTRLLASERERIIAIVLLGLTIPCSAQLGVIAGILAGLGGQYVAVYVLAVFSVLVMAGTALNALLPGNSSDLLIDLPPLRVPRLDNVIRKTATKSYNFIKEATPLFALGALLVSVFQLTGILKFLQNLLAPITVGFLNLPPEAATAFIMGIVRRDFGAAGLANMSLSSIEATVALITITLFVPCIAAILVLFKERGKKEAAIIWGGSWVVAFVFGGMVAQLFDLFGQENSATAPLVMISFILMTTIVAAVSSVVKSRKRKSIVV
ncbi:MAG: ferrous iron transport protein B [Firmicutes bacterium]|nr:ferrous iron transport protein B [Bacillota bacterium]